METLIKATDLRKTFKLSKKQQKINRSNEKLKVALNGVSFECRSGEIYGLLGPNGAGKTTAMRILSTLIKADDGDAIINGASVRTNPDAVRKSIAFMTSELKMDEFFTPNYLYDFYSNLHGVDEETRIERKKKLFDIFEINKFAEVKIAELSTGMKQKVSLAVGLVHDPRIIIFDEPTNGLDVLTAKVVTDFLMDLKKQNKCVIVSTHIFSLVEKVCDRIGIIINGDMIIDDTLKNVCKGKSLEERFFEIYEEVAK